MDSANYENIIALKKELQNYSEDVSVVRRHMEEYKKNIEIAWNDNNGLQVVLETERLNELLTKTANELEQIGADVLEIFEEDTSI